MQVQLTNIEQLRRVRDVSYKDIDKSNLWRSTYHAIAIKWAPATKKSVEKMCQIFDAWEKEIRWLLKN